MDGRILLVVAVILLAGCGSLLGGQSETSTLTPAPVPEPTATEASPLPPGLTGNGVVDMDDFLRAHVRALEGRSFTLRIRESQGDLTGERVLRVEGPRRYYYRDATVLTAGTRTEFVSDGDLFRRSTLGGLQFDRYPAENYSDRYGWLPQAAIRSYVPVGNASVSERQLDGERYYEYSANRDAHPRLDNLRNYSVRATIRPDGLVTSIDVSYVRTSEDRRTNVTRHVRYSDLGTTTVEPPDWVVSRWNSSANSTRGTNSTPSAAQSHRNGGPGAGR